MHTHMTLHDVPVRIETERLLMRALQPGDGGALFDAIDASRDALLPFMSIGIETQTPSDAERKARNAWVRWQKWESFRFGIWERDDDGYPVRMVGTCGLHHGDWAIPRFELGCWIRPDVMGRGYATEVTQALFDFGFNRLNCLKLEIRFDHRNKASQHIVGKLAMRFEARLRAYTRAIDGVVVDEMVYAHLRDDWPGAV